MLREYQHYPTVSPRSSLDSDPWTDSGLLEKNESDVFLTFPCKPDVSWSTNEDPIYSQAVALSLQESIVETGMQHNESDRDQDDVLEPLPAICDRETFLKEAWKEQPIRRPKFSVVQSDVENKEFIQVLRAGGEFELTFQKVQKLLVHLHVSEDLTKLVWNMMRKKHQKYLNVFEIIDVNLEGTIITLTVGLTDTKMILNVTESNAVDRLVETKRFVNAAAKARYWRNAFHRLVNMKLQARVNR